MTDQPSFESSPGFPPPAGQPAGAPTNDDKTWALVAHLGQIVASFIAPLIVLLTKGKESAWVKQQAEEALNFSITLILAIVVFSVLSAILIGIPFLIAAGIAFYVFPIIAGIKSYGGEAYRYPVSIRLIK